MKTVFTAVVVGLLISLLNCRSDSQNNPRAYVEGKISSGTVDYNKFTLKIISADAVMAETMLEAGGNFTLSGPIRSDGFSVAASEKIKSFSADRNGLQLSADAMQISVPAGITYLKFNEIVLEK